VNYERVGAIGIMAAATARHEVVATPSTAVTRVRTILLVLIVVEAERSRRACRRRRPVPIYRMVARRLLREYSVDLTGLSLVEGRSRALHAVRVVRRFERLVRSCRRVGGARRTVVGALDGQLVLARAADH